MKNKTAVNLVFRSGTLTLEAHIKASSLAHERFCMGLAQLSIELISSPCQFHQQLIGVADPRNSRLAPATLLSMATVANDHLAGLAALNQKEVETVSQLQTTSNCSRRTV